MKKLFALLTVVILIVSSVLPAMADSVPADDDTSWEDKIADKENWEAMKAEIPDGTTTANVYFVTRADQRDVAALKHQKMAEQGFVFDEETQSFTYSYYAAIAEEMGVSVEELDKDSNDVKQKMITYYNQEYSYFIDALQELNTQIIEQYLADYPEINSIGRIINYDDLLCGLFMELSVADIEALAKLDCIDNISIDYGMIPSDDESVDDTDGEAGEQLSLAGRSTSYSGYIYNDDIWKTGVNSKDGARTAPVIHRFDSKAELEAFVEKYEPDDRGYDEVPPAREKLAEYDDAFFDRYALILVHFTSSSSCRWQLDGLTWYEDSKTLDVSYRATEYPYGQNDDEQGWFLTVPVLKAKIAGCLEYTVDFWENRWDGGAIAPAEPDEPLPPEDSSEDPSEDPSSEEPSEDITTEEPSEDVTSEDSSDAESSAETVTVTYGDVNGDGDINSLDAAQTLKYDAKLITLEGDALVCADVNGDGTANSLDAAQVLKYDAKLIDGFFTEAE